MNDVERRKKIKEFVEYWSKKDVLSRADVEENIVGAKTNDAGVKANVAGAKQNVVGAKHREPAVGVDTIHSRVGAKHCELAVGANACGARKIGERKEYQNFWNMLLLDIFEVRPYGFIEYEKAVIVDGNKKFIDGYISETKVLIEQKGSNIDLDKEEYQSGGIKLTPAQQARRYAQNLAHNENPRWMVVSNFKEIRIFDLNRTDSYFETIKLKDLDTEWYRLKFLVNVKSDDIKKEEQISIEAGKLVGKLYDALIKQYKNIDDIKSQKSLNVLCVRIVFCLYAEDAGLFAGKQMFYEYLKSFNEENFRDGLINLFKVLNQKEEERDKYLKESLLAFPYVNGGLFSDMDVEVPTFNHEIIDLILNKMSEEFNWSEISPTIFGAIFESTLNPDTRRSGGMHYTSIENIHKVIDPLFLNDLKKEFDEIREIKQKKSRDEKLKNFQDKISNIRFLDPAAGSGNFLTETYISLRKIENEIIKLLYANDKNQTEGQIKIYESIADKENVIKVSIAQFYGIEINDFAVTVANTALWIAEYQALKATEDILNMQIDFLPLKSYHHIVEGNALTFDWHHVVGANPSSVGAKSNVVGAKQNVVGAKHCEPETRMGELREPHIDYIMGNPPFVGARLMNETQKNDLNKIFDGWKNIGDLDYVSCWYKKSVDFIENTNTKVALVSTNSICQGDSVAILWKPLFEKGIEINFAYRTFKWNSESTEKAKVHCIIVGFSNATGAHTVCPYDGKNVGAKHCEPARVADTRLVGVNFVNPKIIYDGDRTQVVSHINAYLIEADDVFVESRNKPICDVPEIGIGNQLIDDGNYLFTEEEKNEFIKSEPKSEKYFHKIYGAEEYINNKTRYCLYLGECSPAELKSMPKCLERVENVKKFRMSSKRAATLKLADRPAHFGTEKVPKTNYLIIPLVSSEKRRYVPIGFLTPDMFATHATQVIPNATLYHFGILTSNVHMAWMRAVAGRLKSDYRYSKDIVYNNFPWPDVLYESGRIISTPTNRALQVFAPTKPYKEFEEHKKKIEETAKGILDARAKFPDSSLADLYDETTMPDILRKAHRENDKEVLKAYGFKTSHIDFTEEMCVGELMKLYKQLTQ